MILSEFIEVKPSGRMIKYYRDLGYDAKYLVPLLVNVKDLSNNSHERISTRCDICGKVTDSIYQNYYRITNGLILPYYCSECASKKVSENCMTEYGVSNHSKRPEVIQKIKDTFENRYGVSNAMDVPEFKERIQETVKAKYGVDYIMEVTEFKERAKEKQAEYLKAHKEEHYEKVRQTNLSKYGVPCTFMLPDAIQKSIEASLKKYGCKNPLQSKEAKEKSRLSMYKNGTAPSSKQQRYLCQLYQGELNYPLKMYLLDIYLPDEKINIEFDGSGHTMSYKLGSITKEEFERREIIRNTTVKNAGMKRIRISSQKDRLPSDSTLLQMLSEAKEYFSKTNHHWCTYDIDQSLLFSAEHKDGIYYDFCELRTIKDSDLNTIKDNNLNTPRKEDDNNENVLW